MNIGLKEKVGSMKVEKRRRYVTTVLVYPKSVKKCIG